jgi:hypothetical protein
MFKILYNPKIVVFLICSAFFACDDDEKEKLRPSIDYATLSPETPYSEAFIDENNTTTVDLAEGNNLHKMFQALNYHSTSSVSANIAIDPEKLQAMFENSGNPFYDISTATISVIGNDLNASGQQLKNAVGSSLSSAEATAVRAKIESLFDGIGAASASVSQTASKGVAGKLGNYLVDAKGIEIAQVIQKSLIGALQLDYIGNVLLDQPGLAADNSQFVSGKNYTAREHNWDIAYGLLTLNQIYLLGATDAARNSVEFGGGSYIWEYNKANYANIYPAFLKGRAAIVNNDADELLIQAYFIRGEFEKAIASAALGYLEKWKAGADDAVRAHAMGEALGFIYSLRFAKVHGADAAFSDDILDGLIDSEFGFWDLEVSKVNAASEAIKVKFNL